MNLQFVKYQATGNDFIIIDGRSFKSEFSVEDISLLCHRRFGIGSDGLIIVKEHPQYDFEIVFFNPDGSQSLCGNGTRAAVKFARKHGFTENEKVNFLAFDGLHDAEILTNGEVRLHMSDVVDYRNVAEDVYVYTGSPHLVRFVNQIEDFPVVQTGSKLRYDWPEKGGTNVNFIEKTGESRLSIRTYERGVENETYSCGTGATAAAIAAGLTDMKSPVKLKTLGGLLEVEFESDPHGSFKNVFLIGPAEEVFSGVFRF